MLDERLSGPVPGGLIALMGGPGTGKTVAGLQFLAEGVLRGGRVAHLTQARPEDVVALAGSIGIELAEHLRAGRWTLLGYQPGFRERYRRTIEPAEVFGELEAFLAEGGGPDRVLVDTCGPLIELREAGNGAELLVDMLSRIGSTAMLTFSAEYPAAVDSAFDLIFQRASLILHVTMTESGRRQFVVRKTLGPQGSSGPISFDIRSGAGIVPFEPVRRERASDLGPEVRRRVLLLDVTGELPEPLLVWFEETFDLFYTRDPVDAFPELARREFGVVALNVDRRSVDRGLHVLRQLRRAAARPPMLIMCGYDLRAADRARALRSGADDFISGGLNPEELASRIEALLRRGRATTNGGAEEPPPPTPAPEIEIKVDRLGELVRARLEAPGAAIFSLVVLRPTNGKKVKALAKHVAANMRRRSEDRLCVKGDRVEVYLDGALRPHAERFLERVRTDGWKKVAADIYTSPTDREALLKVLERQDG